MLANSPKRDREGRTRVKKDETICANKIDTASTSFAAEQKYKFFTGGVIELVYKLLPLVDGHGAVESEVSISEYFSG